MINESTYQNIKDITETILKERLGGVGLIPTGIEEYPNQRFTIGYYDSDTKYQYDVSTSISGNLNVEAHGKSGFIIVPSVHSTYSTVLKQLSDWGGSGDMYRLREAMTEIKLDVRHKGIKPKVFELIVNFGEVAYSHIYMQMKLRNPKGVAFQLGGTMGRLIENINDYVDDVFLPLMEETFFYNKDFFTEIINEAIDKVR